MNSMQRLIVLLALLLAFLPAGCGGGSGGGSGWSGDATTGLVVFSDIHFDPFYDESLFDELLAADASAWAGIFATSTHSHPPAWGSETNYPLLLLALEEIKNRQRAGGVAIFTGDILRHNFADEFYELYGSDDVEAMKEFADKTVAFFVAQVKSALGDTPVMFVLGNNDAYDDYDIEPDGEFLAATAELFYTDLLKRTADREQFFETYAAGGYYSAEPLGAQMMVIGLNTVYFSTSAVGDVDAAADEELDWFDATLAAASAAGKKVWLLMHVPPGANIFSVKNHIDADGRISSASMMWETEYQERFLATLSAYSDAVVWMLAGHTHMDEYRLPDGALAITPGISPVFDNDPAFKVFTFADGSFEPENYVSVSCDLSTRPGAFKGYYNFSTSYSLTGELDSLLAELFPTLATNAALQEHYRGYYYSGHDDANPITDLNWPTYWCGISEMTEDGLVDCVNGY